MLARGVSWLVSVVRSELMVVCCCVLCNVFVWFSLFVVRCLLFVGSCLLLG